MRREIGYVSQRPRPVQYRLPEHEVALSLSSQSAPKIRIAAGGMPKLEPGRMGADCFRLSTRYPGIRMGGDHDFVHHKLSDGDSSYTTVQSVPK
jgi:hypothetical protein